MVFIMNKNEFYCNVLQSEKIVVVCFYDEKNPDCIITEDMLMEIQKENAGAVDLVGVDVATDLTLAQGYNVTSAPTVIVFYKGEIVKKLTGAISKDNIQYILEKLQQ